MGVRCTVRMCVSLPDKAQYGPGKRNMDHLLLSYNLRNILDIYIYIIISINISKLSMQYIILYNLQFPIISKG